MATVSPVAPAGAARSVAGSGAEEALRAAVAGIDAPDVVFAVSRDGHRTVVTGGTGPLPGVPRQELRYEIGSATKTLTCLLLAELARRQYVRFDDPVSRRLPGCGSAGRASSSFPSGITLLHLATHTSGLPRLPRDLYSHALPRWRTNPYAGYSPDRLLRAFAHSRPSRAPGSHWWYSNYGVALLGLALAEAAGTHYPQLLHRRVLAPLGMAATALAPGRHGQDAAGHRADGKTCLPPFDAGGFTASAAVRATPGDLLSYLEAHLRPAATPLPTALLTVQRPLFTRPAPGGCRHTHTLGWVQHETDSGPLCFHSGATMGQEAFLGFRPATGTAVVALATRRYSRGRTITRAAYELLAADEP